MSNNLQSIKARFGVIGASPLLNAALATAVRVAPTDLSVLITGESGVGKEAFSKIIHALSARKHNEFIAINCGAIPEGTINSELFGHEKGSFTGAVGERKGYFETVNKGTIFLDEIGEMPLDTQAYLLRVLENGEFIRVGSSKPMKTDVRVIAATNVQLEERVRQGKFREDLFYRLSTVPIRVPPLRERREDILPLFRKFSHDFAEKYHVDAVKLSDSAEQVLLNYRWPGNIRELKNVAEQLAVLADDRVVDVETLRRLMPQLFERNLPALVTQQAAQGAGEALQERELLYKVLFDMRKDVNELKELIVDLVRRNNLSMPETRLLRALPESASIFASERETQTSDEDLIYDADARQWSSPQAIIIDKKPTATVEPIEEALLSMEEIEKAAIQRALKKYNGRRKEAAEELRISERTLYRKIKQYDI